MARDRDVVAFIHTYARDGSFDPFMSGLIEGFRRVGARLHVIRTNDLVATLGAKSLLWSVSDEKLLQLIRSIDPAFVLSTNRGGITRRMSEELDIPIISWLVDHVPFEHDGANASFFGPREHLVVSATRMVSVMRERYSAVGAKVHFLPFATDPGYFAGSGPSEQEFNVSFIGTYFYGNEFTDLLRRYKSEPQIMKALLAVCKAVETDYRVDTEPLLRSQGIWHLLEQHSIGLRDLEIGMANVASMNKRTRCLDAVADLGLQLWGTENWIDVAYYSLALLRRFRFGEFVKTREQLASIYRRSKIAVDCPHIQAVGGLPYRVFDVLSSPALLIAEFHPESDLFSLFGTDVPVPMYRDTAELRRMTLHYLADEPARREAVARCNSLVARGFSFEDRARELFDIAGGRAPAGRSGETVFIAPESTRSAEGKEVPDEATRVVRIGLRQTGLRQALRAWFPSRRAELKEAVLVLFLSLAYLGLLLIPAPLVQGLGRLVRRLLPASAYAWLVRELILGNATARFDSLQAKTKQKILDLGAKPK